MGNKAELTQPYTDDFVGEFRATASYNLDSIPAFNETKLFGTSQEPSEQSTGIAHSVKVLFKLKSNSFPFQYSYASYGLEQKG